MTFRVCNLKIPPLCLLGLLVFASYSLVPKLVPNKFRDRIVLARVQTMDALRVVWT
jgi:hypothetical protein